MDFVQRVHLWQQHVESGNLEMFPLSKIWQNVHAAALGEIIVKHLKTLEEKMSFYFFSALTGFEIHAAQQLLERT